MHNKLLMDNILIASFSLALLHKYVSVRVAVTNFNDGLMNSFVLFAMLLKNNQPFVYWLRVREIITGILPEVSVSGSKESYAGFLLIFNSKHIKVGSAFSAFWEGDTLYRTRRKQCGRIPGLKRFSDLNKDISIKINCILF